MNTIATLPLVTASLILGQVDITTRAIWIVALRAIRDGEELTYDYSYEYDPESYRDFPCRCHAI